MVLGNLQLIVWQRLALNSCPPASLINMFSRYCFPIRDIIIIVSPPPTRGAGERKVGFGLFSVVLRVKPSAFCGLADLCSV